MLIHWQLFIYRQLLIYLVDPLTTVGPTAPINSTDSFADPLTNSQVVPLVPTDPTASSQFSTICCDASDVIKLPALLTILYCDRYQMKSSRKKQRSFFTTFPLLIVTLNKFLKQLLHSKLVLSGRNSGQGE